MDQDVFLLEREVFFDSVEIHEHKPAVSKSTSIHAQGLTRTQRDKMHVLFHFLRALEHILNPNLHLLYSTEIK